MAQNPRFVFALLLLLSITISSSLPANAAGRGVPNNGHVSKNEDVKRPEFLGFGGYDGTVLIPGFGRVVIPPKGHKVNPFNYNPITGRSGGGTGAINPFQGIIGGGNGGGVGYIPGGDDTFVPNPGAEIPNPVGGAGGNLPPPSRH